MINFGQVNSFGCDSPVGFDTLHAGKNEPRVVTIAQYNAHFAWEPLQKQFPFMADFNSHTHTNIQLNDATAFTLLSTNLRLKQDSPPEAKAITAGPKARNNVVVGGQILQVKGRSISSLIVGNVVVFPFGHKP
jgi:hypothetical protein